MAEAQATPTGETDTEFAFDVAVTESGRRSAHHVTLQRQDYEEWGGDGTTPKDIVERAVELLSERERSDRIMDRFDLREAVRYYPEFGDELRRRLG